VGEAGVGKSRLVYEFLHAHSTQGWRILASAAVSYGTATPYLPVLDLLRRLAHIASHDAPRTVRAKLTGHVLTLDAALQDALPALLALLEVLPDDDGFWHLDPLQRRRQTLDALKGILLRESQEQPLILVCEDVHWIDTETQALLDHLVEGVPMARLLLLVNYRPEYQHGWGSKTYYTQLRLDPLPEASADAFLQLLLGDDPSVAALKRLLMARTGGNPFFLEECVRTLVETGGLVGQPGAYRHTHALPTVQMPATVHAVLAARIDHLPPEEKHVLQTAAVIGTVVPLPLLQTITAGSEDALHQALAHLQAAEFLYETALFPEREYTFTHALTHEVAYGSLLQDHRRALHAQIVDAIEQRAADRLAEQVERLAHHAVQGEVWEKALAYCHQAGAKALARPAYREAAACFEQALIALRHLPDSRAVQEHAIDLRLDLRHALTRLGEQPQVLDHLCAAEALARTLGDHRRLAYVSSHMANLFRVMGDYDRARAAGQHAYAAAVVLGDAALQAAAQQHLGVIAFAVGDYRHAVECFRQNLTLREGGQAWEPLGLSGPPTILSRAWLAGCLGTVGAFTEGKAVSAEAVRIAETIDRPYSLAVAYHGAGLLALRQGALPQAIAILERGLTLCQAWDIRDWYKALATALGYAYALDGRLEAALPLLEQAAEQHAAPRLLGTHSHRVVWLSEGYLLAGRQAEAIPLAQWALTLARDHKQRGYEAYALRLLGAIAAQGEPPDVALSATHYRYALALAEELGMHPLAAHCHLGLGTLYGKTQQWEQARTEVAVAHEMYQSMEMTGWRLQAEAVLGEGR
jgi:tetratricopeptide (TPR) repeat protein